MGVYIRKIHDYEYIYILAGKRQFFLGRTDNLDELDMQNLHKATSIIDKNFDKSVNKYLKDLQDITKYMTAQDRRKYIIARKSIFVNKIQQFRENFVRI